MRSTSTRVADKNFRICGGKHLYEWMLDLALLLYQKKLISQIFVDVDLLSTLQRIDSKYHDIEAFQFYIRDEYLLKPETTSTQLLQRFIERFSVSGSILQTHVTNPLLSFSTVENAIKTAQGSNRPLFSVTSITKRFFDHLHMPINHDPSTLQETQVLKPLYLENSCIYIFPVSEFIRTQSRILDDSIFFEIDPVDGLDIDEEWELLLCDAMLTERYSI